ncbi:ABC transporter permease [Lactiplantibacillus pentosus]|uniref:ABC transporter permease n=1 Tax=Lactiplantibacillus pentosus TaxID=1589 RepID=UPI0021A8B58D|nr:ABC transporter permease [Lactiplantibacillus pentosus]MCT3287547.1 ABC transporter permease [Lactiplantibacillus pentosus]
MSLSMTKIKALFGLKLRLIVSNISLMTAQIMAILYVVFMKSIMQDEAPSHVALVSISLGMGLSFSIVMGGIMMASYPLAEEKEHHTLRVLMTSSITGPEFFIGSLLPPLVIMTITNLILLPLSGASWSQIHLGNFLLITIITSLISLVLGYIIGLITNSQSQAGVISILPMLILSLLPNLEQFNSSLKTISSYLYTSTLNHLITASYTADGFSWTLHEVLLQLGWLVICCGIFFYAYRRQGLDND